jgi:CBS domain-containing protein
MPNLRNILDHRKLYFAETNQTVYEVASRMVELSVGAILVLNRGRVEGIFSERDLMKRVVVEGLDPRTTPVVDVMTVHLATIGPDASLEEARAMMQHHKCRHLPVLDGAEVCGLISMRDLMGKELEMKTDEIHHMRAYIAGSS